MGSGAAVVRFAGGFRVWLVRVVWLACLAVGNVIVSSTKEES